MNCPYTKKTHDNDIELNYENPPKRTTVKVPNNGFVIVRFKADNPGMWFFHCHLFSHMRKGQAMIFDVTDQGIPKVPDNFPTCPIRGPEKIAASELVDRNGIGAPEPQLVVSDVRADCLQLTVFVNLFMLILVI